MFCTRCGNKLDDDDVFCTSCGTKIKKTQEESLQQQTEMSGVATVQIEKGNLDARGSQVEVKKTFDASDAKAAMEGVANKASALLSDMNVMQDGKPSNTFTAIAGGLLAAFTLFIFIKGFIAGGSLTVFNTISRIIMLAGYAVTSFALLCNRRDKVLTAGFGIVTFYILMNFAWVIFEINIGLFTEFWGLSLLIGNFLSVLTWGGSTLIAAVTTTDLLKEGKSIARMLWFMPAVFNMIGRIIHLFSIGNYTDVLTGVLISAILGLAMFGIVFPEGMPVKEAPAVRPNANNYNNTNIANNPNNWNNTNGINNVYIPQNVNHINNTAYQTAPVMDDTMYCGMAKHILLLLLTCGIWQLVWIYKISDFSNAVTDEEPWNAAVKLLLCMFIPFYFIYWTYKAAQRIDKLAALNGIMSDLATICLILSIFIPIVPPILMQDKVNNILDLQRTKTTV